MTLSINESIFAKISMDIRTHRKFSGEKLIHGFSIDSQKPFFASRNWSNQNENRKRKVYFLKLKND